MPYALRRALALTLISGCATTPTALPSIATDRPGNGSSPTTVPALHLQLETSVAYLLDRPASGVVHLASLPTALRLGVSTALELRLGSSLVGLSAPPGAGLAVDVTDTSVGAKVQLLTHDGWIPSLGCVMDLALPSGRGAFTSHVAAPDLRVAAAWSLPRGLGVLLNVGADVSQGEQGRVLRLVYVTNVSYAPALFGGAVTLFAESYGRVPLGSGEPAIVQVDVGGALTLGDDVQLDLFTQHGVSSAAPTLQVAVGWSYRL